MAQKVKNLPTSQETGFQSLGREDPQEKERQPTPVFLPGRSHGQRGLAGCSPRGHKESDTTERLSTEQHMVPDRRILRGFSALGGS